MEAQEPPTLPGRVGNGLGNLENQGQPHNTETLLLGIFARERKTWVQTKACMQMFPASGIIQNSQGAAATQMSTSWGTDKHDVVPPYKGLLFSHEKEWNTDTHTTWKSLRDILLDKKPGTKDYKSYLFTYRKFSEKTNLQSSVVSWDSGVEARVDCKQHKRSFWGAEML